MIALFDMDGTLVRKNTAGLYIKYEYDLGRVSAARVAKVAWWRARYLAGYLNADELAERALRWYQGRALSELRAEMPIWFEQYVKPHVTAAAHAAVERHRQLGHTLVIVTGAAPYAAECVARAFSIDHVVCSEVEVQDGLLSGRLVRPACFGLGKLARTIDWIAQQTPGAGLQQATFYSDSITDLPLLEAVRYPVAVNPDPRLRRVAQQRGWPILAW